MNEGWRIGFAEFLTLGLKWDHQPRYMEVQGIIFNFHMEAKATGAKLGRSLPTASLLGHQRGLGVSPGSLTQGLSSVRRTVL